MLHAEPDPYTNEDGFAMLAQNQVLLNGHRTALTTSVTFSRPRRRRCHLNSPCNGHKARGVRLGIRPETLSTSILWRTKWDTSLRKPHFNRRCENPRLARLRTGSGSPSWVMQVFCARRINLHSIVLSTSEAGKKSSILNTGAAAQFDSASTRLLVTITGGRLYIPKQTPFALAATATTRTATRLLSTGALI